MKIKSAKFIKSSAKLAQCPPQSFPEFAFIGRSNVGKSSLINCLIQRKDLAHTSSNPGKTQTINHYLINESWYLVDLPGYGYAKVSQAKRAEWEKNLREYLRKRENLMNIFVLVDIRIEPQKSDLDFLNWLGQNGLPASVVFTKSDKISVTVINNNKEAFGNRLLESWEELPPSFITSAETGKGRDEILNYISDCCVHFSKPA